jgi:hypothetical protein
MFRENGSAFSMSRQMPHREAPSRRLTRPYWRMLLMNSDAGSGFTWYSTVTRTGRCGIRIDDRRYPPMIPRRQIDAHVRQSQK